MLLRSAHPRFIGTGIWSNWLEPEAYAQLDALLREAHGTQAAGIWLGYEQLADIDTQGLGLAFPGFVSSMPVAQSCKYVAYG
jgi:hypothetical protein